MVSVILLVAALPAGLFASVLEGPHILYRTATAMGRFSSVQVTQQWTVYPKALDVEPFTFEEKAIYVMPNRFRSDIDSDRLQRTHLEFGINTLTVIDGGIVVQADPFDVYQRLLRSRTPSQLMRTVNQLGVETAISSLGRVEDAIVFVLGARYPDKSVSQLAIDKETFLPLRLRLLDNQSGNEQPSVEIFYRDWRKIKTGQYPFHIVFTVEGRLAREIRVTELLPNPTISPEKMDMEALRSTIAQQEVGTPQKQKQATVEEIQQKVKDFQKKFE